MPGNSQPPNIVLILADNLGWGELGCYGGGMLRGAPTPRIDKLASEGLRFLNFNVESDCVPTRYALMTGRHPIRTGALQSIPAGLPQGIIPWEVTIAQLLSARGYATAIYGKWHLGDREGRFPKDRGFDEWYGIPRTTNETMFASSVGFDPSVVDQPYVMEGRVGNRASSGWARPGPGGARTTPKWKARCASRSCCAGLAMCELPKSPTTSSMLWTCTRRWRESPGPRSRRTERSTASTSLISFLGVRSTQTAKGLSTT